MGRIIFSFAFRIKTIEWHVVLLSFLLKYIIVLVQAYVSILLGANSIALLKEKNGGENWLIYFYRDLI